MAEWGNTSLVTDVPRWERAGEKKEKLEKGSKSGMGARVLGREGPRSHKLLQFILSLQTDPADSDFSKTLQIHTH